MMAGRCRDRSGGATVCAAAEAVDRARTRNVRRESIDMTVSLAHGA